MNWYLDVLKKYAVFSGRARRKEYWMFLLITVMIAVLLGVLEGMLGLPGVISWIYQLAMLIPSLAVGVRRMHDTNHSGWWLLLPIVNLVFAVTGGQRADNRFGPDPKGTAA